MHLHEVYMNTVVSLGAIAINFLFVIIYVLPKTIIAIIIIC